MAEILVIHGPNLNLLGEREPEIYGRVTLVDINERLQKLAKQAGHRAQCFQSNAEHELVDRIQQAKKENVAFIIMNAAALTHTSVALRDAIAFCKIPFIEVHLSNIYARESFRQQSYCAELAVGVISGLGPQGYEFAMQYAIEQLKK